jgi:uncharacterized protein (DUF1501 family)
LLNIKPYKGWVRCEASDNQQSAISNPLSPAICIEKGRPMPRHPLTRREFLTAGVTLVGAAASVPTFLTHTAWAMSDPDSAVQSKPGVPDERILVVIQLSGGNDGLNTLVPYRWDEYYKSRPAIAVPRDQVLRLTSAAEVGLHPSMSALKAMFDDGRCAIVQGVGYPNPNRSHFASMDIWHTGDALHGAGGGRGVGWIGQALDQAALPDGRAEPCACVSIGDEIPLATVGKSVKPIAFARANLFRWFGGDLHPRLATEYDRLNRAGVLDDSASMPSPGVTRQPQTIRPGSAAAFVQRTALDAQLASDRVRDAVQGQTVTNFPGGALAGQLRTVALMIKAQMPTRVYYVALGGFDTHAGQTNRQPNLLREFAAAVQAFHHELKAQGQEQRVLTLAFSEFGRRVQQNASNGTDHGTAGPVFLLGPMVRPGLLGEYPSLNQLDQGDLIHTADFRSLYATILSRWLQADPTPILGQRFREADILRV